MLPLNNYCPIRSDKKNIVCFSLKAGLYVIFMVSTSCLLRSFE